MRKIYPLYFCVILLLSFFLCFKNGAEAQALRLDFSHINHEQGLSNSSVETIYQDSRGFLWFGTIDGLNRFDGNRIKVYKNDKGDDNSLSNSFIHSIFEDRQHRLWIGTSNGLNLYDPVHNNFKQFKHRSTYTELNGDRINNIYQGIGETLWVCTAWGALSEFDIKTGKFTDYFYDGRLGKPSENKYVYCIAQRDSHSFWVGTQNGLKVFDLITRHYADTLNPFKTSLPYKIRTIAIAANNLLWLGTEENGVFKINLSNNKLYAYQHNTGAPGNIASDRIISMLVDESDRLLVGTVNGGLNIFDPINNTFIVYTNNPAIQTSLSQRTVAAIYKDKQQNLWIGTPRGGVNVASLQKVNFELFRNEVGANTLSYNDVKSFCEDKNGRIWVGTDGGGLNYFDRPSRTFEAFRFDSRNNKSLGSDQVMSLCSDHLNNLWVGTFDGGLNLFDPKSKSFTRFIHNSKDSSSITSNLVESIFEDREHRLWICTYNGGLDLFDPIKRKFRLMGQGQSPETKIFGIKLLSIAEDHKGQLWIVTDDNGLNCYNPRTGKVRHYFEGSKNPDLAVVFIDHAGRVWAGKKGLYLYDESKDKFSLFTEEGNLADEYIKGIVEGRSGELWISTSNGIVQYDTNTNHVKLFNSNDGLQGPDFEVNACLKASDGTIFFGGTNGFNMFDPRTISVNRFYPPVYFTDFYIFNKRVEPGINSTLQTDIAYAKNIKLNYQQSSIAFDFEALNFVKNENNSYAYKLDNFDRDWIYTGHAHHAAYTNLDPGKYVFRVRASNNDGIWNPNEAAIVITIAPPFWRTWWFMLLCTIIILCCAYLILNFKRKLDIRALQEKQREDIYRLQLQFFTNISHEFRTPLTLILGPVEALMQDNAQPKETEYYKTIQRNATRLMTLINELMDFKKVESGILKLKVNAYNSSEYIHEITRDFFNLASQKQINFTVNAGPDKQLWLDRDILDKMIFNLLNNSFKYTENGGNVNISVFYDVKDLIVSFENELIIKNNFRASDYFFVSVSDSGIGISRESIPHLFERYYRVNNTHLGSGVGLAFVKSLAEIHKSDIYVYSERLKGTAIIIALPLSESNYTALEKMSEGNESSVLLESLIADDQFKLFETASPLSNEIQVKPKYDDHILIVEDNYELRTFLKNELSVYYTVSEAENGRSALEKIDEVFPDLIITDIMMPEMDGIALSTAIKNNIETSHIPLIMLTAKDNAASKIEGVSSGADIYISKPFSIAFLIVTIRNVFDKQENLRKFYANNYFAEVNELVHSAKDKEFMEKFVHIIETQLFNPDLEVELLAQELAMSKSKLYQKIKKITGQSIVEFIRSFRLKKAVQIMTHEDVALGEVMLRVGFQTQSYFTKSFKSEYGKTPSQFLNDLKK